MIYFYFFFFQNMLDVFWCPDRFDVPLESVDIPLSIYFLKEN